MKFSAKQTYSGSLSRSENLKIVLDFRVTIDSQQLPEMDSDADSLFSVPYNLVSSELAAAYVDDEKRETIPVIDSDGLIVTVARFHNDQYLFHLPLDIATEARLGNLYFEFSLNARFHDSISNKKGRDGDTKAILILSVS